MKSKLIFTIAFLFSLSIVAAQKSNINESPKLSHYLKGVPNPEDLMEIPGSDWIVVSSMAGDNNSSGRIYCVNRKTEKLLSLFNIDKGKTKLGYNNLERFAPHGIYIRQIAINNYRLMVINHGSREAIETFQLYFKDALPELLWESNINFPGNVWANGLVTDNSGNIYATAMYDPNDKEFLQKFSAKIPTGQVWKWTPSNGWLPFYKKTFSAANGIAISKNGKYLYVSEWAARRIYKLSTTNSLDTTSVTVDFLPDNIRWTKDNEMTVTGQKSSPMTLFTNKGVNKKIIYFSIIKINPNSLKTRKIIEGGDKNFANATGTLEIGDTYWVGCVADDKIAIYNK
ncbi:SMP-30/gluconolactonase/LRE family protein [Mucilaginibacter sp.]|uniref:SMP-30/gluconolactonase/LRE family protein n=1 Tax=Mucilaginibacter sp. TaxID=1882438 RepID=UPI0025DBC91F|nr:SMP-30/gluconolactonase/LRE family protein [Mucilaginibacter sp.]